jgi:hypothetical protein
MLPWWTQQNPNRWGRPKQKHYDEIGVCAQNRLLIVNSIINTKLEGCMCSSTHNRNFHFDFIWFVSIQIQFWSLKQKYAWSTIVDRMRQFFIQSKLSRGVGSAHNMAIYLPLVNCKLTCPVSVDEYAKPLMKAVAREDYGPKYRAHVSRYHMNNGGFWDLGK